MGRRAAMNARKRRQRVLYGSVVVAVIALIVVFYLIYQAATVDPYSNYIGDPVSTGIMQDLTGVSNSTLSQVGVPSGVSSLTTLSGTLLTTNGEPEVLYVGGEFCPFCAVERWAIIVALSQFGTFNGLEYMQSSSTDVNPNTPTFTFNGPSFSYTSKDLVFVPVEEYNRSEAVIQNLTTQQSSLLSQYDVCSSSSTESSGGIPFVDIANIYGVTCGAQSSIVLSDENWTQVASKLNDPTSNVAQQIDGAANTLISAICAADHQAGITPTGPNGNVCSEPFASDLSFASPVPASAPSSSLAAAPAYLDPRWTD